MDPSSSMSVNGCDGAIVAIPLANCEGKLVMKHVCQRKFLTIGICAVPALGQSAEYGLSLLKGDPDV